MPSIFSSKNAQHENKQFLRGHQLFLIKNFFFGNSSGPTLSAIYSFEGGGQSTLFNLRKIDLKLVLLLYKYKSMYFFKVYT